jgi:hypothetical protein
MILQTNNTEYDFRYINILNLLRNHLQQSVPGLRFPFGPLPLEHGRMRQVIVDFARDNCNVDGCFIDHSNSELKLSQYILVNMSTPDNASYVARTLGT